MADPTAANEGNKYAPDSAGEFLRWPREQSKPTFPSSFAEMAKGITSAVETGAEELNKGVKQFMKNVGINAGETEQKDYLKGVQTAYGVAFGKGGDTSTGTTPSGDTLTPGASAAPKDVDAGLTGIKNLKAAYDQGGVPRHLRETEYLGNLYMRAQALRTRFPGYREYIDKGIEEATGITPNANSYIKNMLSDINELITKSKDTDHHARNIVQTQAGEGNQNAVAEHELIQKGKDPNKALADLGRANLPHYQAKLAEDRFKTMDANSKMAQSAVEDESRSFLNQNAGTKMRQALEGINLDEATLDKMSRGELTFEQLGVKPREVLGYIQNQKRLVQKDHDNYWNANVEFKDGTKSTRRALIRDKIDSVNKDVMTAWDALEKGFTDGDAGYIGRVANAVKDINNNALWSVWNSDKGAFFRATKVAKEMAGDQAIPALIGSPGWDKPTVESINAMIGSTLSGESKTKVGLRGMKEAMLTADKETHGEKPAAITAYITGLSKLIGMNTVPTEAQANVLEHLFDPKYDKEGEKSWIGLIKEDGKSVFRHGVYERFANPEFAKNVEKVSRENRRPELLENYHNFMRTTFGQDIFREDISELGKQQVYGYSGATRAGINITWQTPKGKAPYFEAHETPGFHAPGVHPTARAQAFNDSVKKLNQGIRGLYGVFGDETAKILINEFGARSALELGEKGSTARALMLTLKPNPTSAAGKEAEAGKAAMSVKPSLYSETPKFPLNDTSGVPRTWGQVLPESANEWIRGAVERAKTGPKPPQWYNDFWNAPLDSSSIKSRPAETVGPDGIPRVPIRSSIP